MGSQMDTVIIFLFWLFPKPLDIQITRSRYLKACLDLPEDNWNTFKTIKDLPETFSSKEKPLLSCTMSGQNLKKSWFPKMCFLLDHNAYFNYFCPNCARQKWLFLVSDCFKSIPMFFR